MCLEVVSVLEALAEDTVVVNLAVDRQRDGLVVVDQGLGARVCSLSVTASKGSCRVTSYRRQRWTDARGQGLQNVSRGPGGIFPGNVLLVSFATQLPPVGGQLLKVPARGVRVGSLQSGPRCRMLLR